MDVEEFDRGLKKRAILDWISEGGTLREWCRQNGISFVTVYNWKKKDEEFSRRFKEARDTGYDALAQECIEIADQSNDDSDPKRDKLRVWTRLQLLSKWYPQRYGERLNLKHEGKIDIGTRLLEARERVKKK